MAYGDMSLGGAAVVVYSNKMMGWLNQTGELYVKTIYDIGESNIVATENGFAITKASAHEMEKGILLSVPGGEYTIPKTIDGVNVETVIIEMITGSPTLEHYVKITHNDVANISKMTIKKGAKQVIADYAGALSFDIQIIDVTDCGDDVILPEILLNSSDATIYVTATAKENLYKENTNVVGV